MINVNRRYFSWILTPRERQIFLPTLIILSIFSAILEAISLSVILPVLQLIDPNSSTNINSFVKYFIPIGLEGNNSPKFIIILAIVIIFISSIFRSFTIYYTNMKINHIRASMSTRLYQRYLSQDLEFFSSNQKSIIVKNITSEVDMFINSFLLPIIQITTNTMLLFFISCILFVAYPFATFLSIIIFGSMYFLIFTTLKGRIRAFGKQKVSKNGERFKLITESLADIKLLKINSKSNIYTEKVEKLNSVFAKSIASVQTIAATPRYFMEMISLSLILLSLLYFVSSDKYTTTDIQGLVPMFGLFVLAAMKLLPAIQIIYHSIATARSGVASAELLASTFQEVKECECSDERVDLEFNRGIRLNGVSFGYGQHGIEVLHDLNVTIPKGSATAFVGVTGSGKTTCVDIILGLLQPTTGCVYIDDTVLVAQNIKSWQSKIGYVPQEVILQDWSVYQNVADKEFLTEAEQEKVVDVCKLAAVHEDIITNFPNGYNTLVGERGDKISGGQRQRIGIARALFNSPDLLVLDEATNALDDQTVSLIQNVLANLKGKITQIIISHQDNTYQHCDQILDLNELQN